MEGLISVWDVMRVLNLLIATYVLIKVAGLYSWWDGQIKSVRFTLMGLVGVLVISGYGSLEALIQTSPGGPRVALFTPMLTITAYGITLLTKERRELNSHPKEKK